MLARFRVAALIALALFASVGAAHAATVEIPIGTWAADLITTIILPIVGTAVLWLLAQFRGPWVQSLRTQAAEQLLAHAIAYGFNATAGAVRGKAVSIEIGNTVVATALSYAVTNGPHWLVAWLGGAEGVRDKILARLTVPEDAAILGGVIVPAPPPAA